MIVRSGAAPLLFLAIATVAPGAVAAVRVDPFTVSKNDESLGYFGAEVGRAVASALERSGAAAQPSELVVTGRIEQLDAAHVRLSGSAAGTTVIADGPLESIDEVATRLGERLATALLAAPPAHTGRTQPPALRRVAERANKHERHRAPVSNEAATAAKPNTVPAVEVASAEAGSAPAADTAAPEGNPPQISPPVEASPRPEASPPAASQPPSPAVTAELAAPPPAVPPPAAAPAGPGSLALVPSSPFRERSAPADPGFGRNRVVVHAVADPPGAYPGAGISATQALYTFFARRLRLEVLPGPIGMAAPELAADGAARAGARVAVMARLDGIEYFAGGAGAGVRCRLELTMVRDGQVAFRRAVDSPPIFPSRRSRDPLQRAVTFVLEAVLPDLVTALTR